MHYNGQTARQKSGDNISDNLGKKHVRRYLISQILPVSDAQKNRFNG